MADDVLRMQAEVVDKASAPLRRISQELQGIKATPGMQHARGELEKLREVMREFTLGGGGVTGALGAVGLGSVTAAFSIAELARSFRELAKGRVELNYLARDTDLAVDQIRRLQAVGKRFDIAPEAVTQDLQRFSDVMVDFKRGAGEAFNEFGRRFPEAAAQVRRDTSAWDQLGHVLGKIGEIKDPQIQKRWLDLFGLGDMGRMFGRGVEGFRKEFEEASKAIGASPSGLDDAAERAEKAVKRFDEALERFKLKAAPGAFAGMTKVVDGATVLFEKVIPGAIDRLEAFAGGPIGQFFAKVLALVQNERAKEDEAETGRFRRGLDGQIRTRVKELSERKAYLEDTIGKASPDAVALPALRRELEQVTETLKQMRERFKDILGETRPQSFEGGGLAGLVHPASLTGAGVSEPVRRSMAAASEAAAPVASDGRPVTPFTGSRSFDAKAPEVMSRLMSDFRLTPEQAAGIVGNLGHESGGFRQMQELRPRGGMGGWGWAQWTGPRRREFMAWADDQGLDPRSDEANYGFLRHELNTKYARAIAAVRQTRSAHDAMLAFERIFEGAGVKAYGSRDRWTGRALRDYRDSPELFARPKGDLYRAGQDAGLIGGKVRHEGGADINLKIDGAPVRSMKASTFGLVQSVKLQRGTSMTVPSNEA